MKNKILGLLILIFFILGSLLLEGGQASIFMVPTSMLIVLGTTLGLLVMYYRKGMGKNQILKKMKQYFIFSGYLSLLVAAIMILACFPESDLTSVVHVARASSVSLVGLFYGYIFGYIVDTFIE